MDAKDSNFWFVDDRCCSEATEATKACDGEGGTSEVLDTSFSVSGSSSDATHFSRGLPDVHCFDVLHDRDKQSTIGLCGDAEVDGFVASDHICFIIVECVAFWSLCKRLDEGLHDERQVGQLWCAFWPCCVEVLAEFFQ